VVEQFFRVHGAMPHHIRPWLDLITMGLCGFEYKIREALLQAGLLPLLHLEH
jgi:hypothetical protein